MTYYRNDLFEKAGIAVSAAPTYAQIAGYAEKITNKPNQGYDLQGLHQDRRGRERVGCDPAGFLNTVVKKP